MSADVMSMNPAHVVVYSVTGYGNSSSGGLFMLGMGAAAAQYMIARSQSLFNATETLSAVAKAYTGDKNSPQIPDDAAHLLPTDASRLDPNGKPWTQFAIADWTERLAKKLKPNATSEADKAWNATFNSYIQAWNTRAGLQGTQKEAATSEINAWSKGESSMIQEAQQTVQSVPSVSSAAITYVTAGAQLLSA